VWRPKGCWQQRPGGCARRGSYGHRLFGGRPLRQCGALDPG